MAQKEHERSAPIIDGGSGRLALENLAVLCGYWGVSHVNWLVFKNVGVLPMPIWPAAAVALVAAFVFGWRIAPGIALGTILANAVSLNSSLAFASCIAVMNTLGPLLAASATRRRLSGKLWSEWSPMDIVAVFMACVIVSPLLAAFGGIGGKWLLGLIPSPEVPMAIMRWWLSHALGTLLFVPPLFFCLPRKWMT